MTDRRNDIAAELERGLQETVAFFKSLSPAELATQVYQDGAQWSGIRPAFPVGAVLGRLFVWERRPAAIFFRNRDRICHGAMLG
jgi:hypothetical protein